MTRQLILNYVIGTQGYPWAAWRHPSSDVRRVTEIEHYLEQAELAERGCFDLMFLVDHIGLFPSQDAPLFWTLDPVLLMTALATHTSDIGLIATIGTSYTPPFETSRALSTLDHLSRGRAGWNVVTSHSDLAARNHGETTTPSSEDRYRRARGYLDAAIALWHAWESDAVTANRETGQLVDPEKIHAVNFASADFRVRGPLSTPRTPQVVPLLCQAGPSPAGRALAGDYADLVYARYANAAESREYRNDLRSRAAAAGRGAEAVKLLPSVTPYVASTEAGARRFFRELMDLSTPSALLPGVAEALDIALDEGDLDEVVDPELRVRAAEQWPWITSSGTVDLTGATEQPTWRALIQATDPRHQHGMLIGTPEHVAARIAEDFRAGAFDGLSIGVPLVPGSLRDFVEQVVPLLQESGVHKREYASGTLRDRLDLPVTHTVDRSRWTGHYAS